MAKKEKIEPAELVPKNVDANQSEEKIEKASEEQPAPEEIPADFEDAVEVAEAVVPPASQKEVRFVARETFSCTVGGVRYSFRAERECKVPADVASILVNGKKGYRV